MVLNSIIQSGQSAHAGVDGLFASDSLKQIGDTLRNAGSYQLEVTAGVHGGSSLVHASGALTVGAGKDNDIILFGAGIAQMHFEIVLPKGVMEKLRITPLEAAVTLEDGSRVEVGQYAEISTSSIVTFGDSELSINRIADPRKFVKPGLRLMAFVCVIAMLPISYSLLSNAAVGIADASSQVINTIGSKVNQTSKQYLGKTVALLGNDKDEVTQAYTWTVRTQLEDLKLNHRLRASSTPDGSIRVSGNISDRELGRWTAFLQWYDTKPNFPSLIRDVNRSGVDRDLPSIKSVWLDDKPTVFFKDGTVGNIGASIKGGWKIVAINPESVMIERDGATVSLTY